MRERVPGGGTRSIRKWISLRFMQNIYQGNRKADKHQTEDRSLRLLRERVPGGGARNDRGSAARQRRSGGVSRLRRVRGVDR